MRILSPQTVMHHKKTRNQIHELFGSGIMDGIGISVITGISVTGSGVMSSIAGVVDGVEGSEPSGLGDSFPGVGEVSL